MALTPAEDKQAVWERIRRDKWITTRLGFSNLNDTQIAEYIRTRRTVDDELTSSSRFILIFDPPSQDLPGGAGELYELSCIEVDVLVAISMQPQADMILSQIIGLCGKGWSVNGRPVYKVVRTGDLTAAAGFYRCGVRIFYHSCTKNKIQKL